VHRSALTFEQVRRTLLKELSPGATKQGVPDRTVYDDDNPSKTTSSAFKVTIA
jgi:hypothetical protein